MKRRMLCLLILAASPWFLGCSDDTTPAADAAPDAPAPRGYGIACASDGECASALCVDGFCAKVCKRLADCPVISGQPFDCGEVAERTQVLCYPRRYRTEAHTIGHDCSMDGACAVGYTCTGIAGETDRTCTTTCESDQNCPPRYRCASQRVANGAVEKLCRRREFCHPCVIDDQCGPDNLCITDTNGNKYCGKSCTATGTTCPPWAKCEDAGNGKLQCKHKAGFCYRSLKGEGEQCQPCFIHGWIPGPKAVGDKTVAEDGTCKAEGFCHLLSSYSMEAACLMPCEAGDTCPNDFACWKEAVALGGGNFCVPVDQATGGFGSCVP